ncbi:MAG: Rrf2 family transcriptional regulator [Bacteroidia bacterium]|nr:Rrf2 family transcriptional regulator [Bacteroidia bacterium]MCZ2277762.1 Rrf2 family transcriptional regulator [Bacteroidia bacterium]
MLSLTCKASIKAVIYLGSKYDSKSKAGIKEIAEFINENEHTVGKLLQRLVKKQIINSSKGPKGGFFITNRQKNQHVIQIVYAIDGKEVFGKCGLGLSKCSETRPCPFHNDFKPIRDLFKKMCAEKRICDLYEEVNKGIAYLTG